MPFATFKVPQAALSKAQKAEVVIGRSPPFPRDQSPATARVRLAPCPERLR